MLWNSSDSYLVKDILPYSRGARAFKEEVLAIFYLFWAKKAASLNVQMPSLHKISSLQSIKHSEPEDKGASGSSVSMPNQFVPKIILPLHSYNISYAEDIVNVPALESVDTTLSGTGVR